jgi:Histidine kinase/Two component regulator propeller
MRIKNVIIFTLFFSAIRFKNRFMFKNRAYRFYLSAIFTLLFLHTLPAQEYSYIHYDAKNGLADNYVYHAVQDHDGFLWFATEIGVSRFDGTKFVNFTTADGLPDNEILKLFVDSKNRVWMMPFKNSLCYYYKNKIYNATNDSLLAKIKLTGNTFDMQEDGRGNIIIAEMSNVTLINTFGKITSFSKFNGSILYGKSIGLDKEKNIMLITVNDTTSKKEFYTLDSNFNFIQNEKLTYLNNDKVAGSKISFCNGSQIAEFGLTKNANSIFSISTINNGVIFDTLLTSAINTFSNLSPKVAHINTKRGCIAWHFTDNQKTINYLPSENIAFSFEDKEHNKWFTTLGSGIFRLVSSDIKSIQFNDKEAIKNQIHTIFADKNRVIAGSGEKKLYYIESEKIKSDAEINNAQTGKMIKIIKFGDKYFLLCEFGLFSTTDFIKFNSALWGGLKRAYYSYKDMAISATGDFYLATNSSILKISLQQQNKKHDILYTGRCFSICILGNYVYFSALNGLNRIDLKTNKTEYLGNIDVLLQKRITKLVWHNNLLWIGTSDNGLVCFDGNKIIHKISTQNGLTSNIIEALYADKNCIYAGTDKGLNKIELINNEIASITKISLQNGLPSNKINGICKLNDTLYLATPYGVSFFKDTSINNNSNCDLKITDLIVDGKQKQDSLPIILEAGTKNSLLVKFVGISFKGAEGTTYFYRLKGLTNNDWKPAETNVLEFISLPNGNYLLEIKAINGFGKESQIVAISFEVAKKLTEKWWFRALAVLFLGGLIWWIFTLQMANLKKKEKLKLDTNLRISRLEQMALKAQMNPHFIFNCLNSIQQFVIEHDVQGANKFISKFSKLIRQTLDNSGKEKISIEEEISFLSSYLALEKMRFEDKFNYTFDVDTAINTSETYIPPMLLQPFIENSIRHGIRLKDNNEGLIEVRIEAEDHFIVCRLIDNGIGRAAAAQFKTNQHIPYQSKGMLLTEQRIDVMNANKTELIKVEIHDRDAAKGETGTEVVIRFPKNFTQNRHFNQ